MFTCYLKAICALMVVFCHINGAFFHSNAWWAECVNTPTIIKNSWPNLFVKISIVDYGLQCGFFAVFSVMMFFLCSSYGCFFSMDKKNIYSFLHSRFNKLYPIFFITTIINITLIYINAWLYNIPINHSYKVLLSQFGMSLQEFWGGKDILCVTWFLSILIIFYILNSILYYIYKYFFQNRMFYLFFSDFCIFLLLLTTTYSKTNIQRYDLIQKALTIILFMENGYIFYLSKQKVISNLSMLLCLIFQMIFSAVIYRNFGARYITANEFWAYQIIVISIFWISFLYSDKMIKIKFLEQTADLSYILYLIHGFLGFTIVSYSVLRLNISKSVSCILAFFIVYYISYFLHLFVETPILRFFSSFQKENVSNNNRKLNDK